MDCSEPTKWAQLPAGDSWYFSGLLCSVFFFFFFLSPFPGAGHLSIIDMIREIKLEKVT